MTFLAPSFLNGPSSFLQVTNEDNHKSLDEFQFQPDHNTDYDVSFP